MAVNWVECRPGFFIPTTINCSQFPPYDEFDPSLPEFDDVLVFGDAFRLPKWAWGAWYSAQRADKPLKIDAGLQQAVAQNVYEMKRYVNIVPKWRRWMIETLSEIDDIEDQLSTVLWMIELIGRKALPIPRGVLSGAQNVRRLLDRASNLLAGVQLSRRSKAEWKNEQTKIRKLKRKSRSNLARLIIWFRQNWGRLLEAGQATGTWFDAGIVLGPIFAFVEEGLWGLVANTRDNYLIGVDAFLPGYSDDFKFQVKKFNDDVSDGLELTIEGLTWGKDAILEPLLEATAFIGDTHRWGYTDAAQVQLAQLPRPLLSGYLGAAAVTGLTVPAVAATLDSMWQPINDTFSVGQLVSDAWLETVVDVTNTGFEDVDAFPDEP